MKKASKEEREKKKYLDDLIKEVESDFEKRKKERISYERQWQLNMNFLSGNQYCYLNSAGEIEGENKTYFWQNRGVYNHIAPIIDSRQAKFSRIETGVSVRPKTDDDKDIAAASLAEKLIENAFKNSDFTAVVKKVTAWSEACGTGFYKVIWNNGGGQKLGEVDGVEVFEGEVDVMPVSPFEIFPDSLYTENIEDCKSVIHARVMTVGDIYEKYGVTVDGKKVSVYSLKSLPDFNNGVDDTIDNACVVIERYEKPCAAL